MSDALRPATVTDRLVAPEVTRYLDGEGHIVVRTRERPDYWFGNYLLLPSAPRASELQALNAAWSRELGSDPRLARMIIQWETALDSPSRAPDVVNGELIEDAVLLLDRSSEPPAIAAEVQSVDNDATWDAVVDLATESDAQLRDFQAWRYAAYRQLVEAGRGGWFAIAEQGEVVCAGGVFSANGWSRLQNIVTGAKWRRRGLASKLCAALANAAIARDRNTQLVVVCSLDGDAQRIYERAGFRQVGRQYSLILPRPVTAR